MRPGAMGDGVLVDTLFSGISRGTERLVLDGRVPDSEHDRMRGPAMEGAFPFPVKYGYSAVGRVAEGRLAGRAVFALHPHQSRFRLPEDALTPLPEGLPPARAVLAANMETALTLIWDSGAGPGDRIAVVGAGVVGALTAYLAARLPGAEVTLIDTNPARAALARDMGCAFADPSGAPAECDVVLHLSASAEGLGTAMACAGTEATIVEGSWHGTGNVAVPLGGAFHSRRLRVVGSQVGRIPAARAPRWTYARRLAKALDLLQDDTLDALVSGETEFTDLPDRYAAILSDPATLCHRIRYDPK
ncbi:zinc-binding alcohol dehydrogenase (plasmid) [Palleronia sp. LCG004]|nr:zinc-binding alcohol dehydrogenase [Palleronia sp. LCG004]WOI58352.1 zinc-binding alcohol dehydrogenase [Palleronia sp. LCG004]